MVINQSKLRTKIFAFRYNFFTLYNTDSQLAKKIFMVVRVKLIKLWYLLVGLFMLYLSVASVAQTPVGSWESILKNKQGTLTVYFLENEPFIYQEKDSQKLQGIEYELLRGFVRYVKKVYQVELTMVFQPVTNFSKLYNKIKNSAPTQARLGISSFSIIPNRISEVGLTSPYCPDIEVLITNSAVPGIDDQQDFKKILHDFTALYIKDSSFEENLSLIQQVIPDIRTQGVSNSDDILRKINSEIDKFGYIELPKYLLGLKKGLRIKRQNLLKVTREGYTMIFPKGGDWGEPLNAFFASAAFKAQLNSTLKNYLGKDIQELLIKAKSEVISNSNQDILVIEQKLKTLELQKKDIEHKRDRLYIDIFIVGLVLAALIMILLFRNNLQKQKSNRLLMQQKEEIEAQKDALAKKNEQILQQKKEIAQQRDDVVAKNIEIERRKEELNKLNQVKDRLFSIVSHDLRSPLNSLKGTLTLMEMGALGENELQHFTGELNKELAYVLELLENLLKWAKAQMEGIEPQTKQINLYKLVKTNIGLLRPVAEKKMIHLMNEVAEDVEAWGDEEMIKLVIRNLLSNAIKFTKASGHITVQCRHMTNELEVAIIDNGVGISLEKQVALFNTDTHFTTQGTQSEKGTGLGLLICKEFIEKNNGRIWVESELKKGSIFRFTLPKNEAILDR